MRTCTRLTLICLAALMVTPPGIAAEIFTGEKAWEMRRKMYCGTMEDGVARFGIWEGRAYSRIPGQKDVHIFDVIGVNTRQCGTVEDEEKGTGFKSVSREVMLYLDPITNEMIDTWENPWTGETVEVVHVANDPVNMRAPAFVLGRDGKPAKVSARRSGDMLVTSDEVPLFYKNPLGGEYQEYVGGSYHAMEIFNTFYDAEELLNGTSLSISRVAWTRIAQWLPWMKMGSRSGLMVINATGFSTFDANDIPEPLLSVLNERYPRYLTPPPTHDNRPNETSWTVFKKHLAKQQGKK